jgi:hypothetical protein
LSLLGEVILRGDSYLTQNNQADGFVDDYALYNARLNYASASGSWNITLWGKNLSDEDVKQRLFDLLDQDLIGQNFIVLADPRTTASRCGWTSSAVECSMQAGRPWHSAR